MNNSVMKRPADILNSLIKESSAYTSMDMIESIIESSMDLSEYPIQPLYLALKNLTIEKRGMILEKFSKEQRQAFLDLDLWDKDNLDVHSFKAWIATYNECKNEEIRSEFITSNEFLLYIKANFNIWTFDVEDPNYPDHDYYFLTDDSQLLFEYSEEFEFSNEVRELVRNLYGDLGVEEAYILLFKVVSDSFSNFQEEEYQNKKENLRDFGFVDYYDALETLREFPSLSHMDHFIKSKKSVTANIDITGQKQALHYSSLIAFKDKSELISEELSKVEEDKRVEHLHFDFIRLVNATISLGNSLKNGTVAMTKTGNITRAYLNLGINYIRTMAGEDHSVFDKFEFMDIYRVGLTLTLSIKKKLKKSLTTYESDKNFESFLGRKMIDYLDYSFQAPPCFYSKELEKEVPISTVEMFNSWKDQSECYIALLPFVNTFYKTFSELSETGKLQDSFYLNYNIEDIDFEVIFITTFANFILDELVDRGADAPRMGISIDHLKMFLEEISLMTGEMTDNKIETWSDRFIDKFGMKDVPLLKEFIISITCTELEGYDYHNLKLEEYKFVGGPILLNMH